MMYVCDQYGGTMHDVCIANSTARPQSIRKDMHQDTPTEQTINMKPLYSSQKLGIKREKWQWEGIDLNKIYRMC